MKIESNKKKREISNDFEWIIWLIAEEYMNTLKIQIKMNLICKKIKSNLKVKNKVGQTIISTMKLWISEFLRNKEWKNEKRTINSTN